MKKKVFGIVAAVAVVAIAGVNYLQMNQDVEMSDLALANVEALARGEDEVTCKKDPGDTCVVGNTSVSDYDEKDSWF